MDYRLTNRTFSREWRRSKRYSDHELRWLARRRGFLVRYVGDALQVYLKATGKTVAHFEPIQKVTTKKNARNART
jgi:hypothetical protein